MPVCPFWMGEMVWSTWSCFKGLVSAQSRDPLAHPPQPPPGWGGLPRGQRDRQYLVEAQIILEGMRGVEDCPICGDHQDKTIQSLWAKHIRAEETKIEVRRTRYKREIRDCISPLSLVSKWEQLVLCFRPTKHFSAAPPPPTHMGTWVRKQTNKQTSKDIYLIYTEQTQGWQPNQTHTHKPLKHVHPH